MTLVWHVCSFDWRVLLLVYLDIDVTQVMCSQAIFAYKTGWWEHLGQGYAVAYI